MGRLSRCFHALTACSLLWAATGTEAGIIGSKHDLSINASVQVCVQCHTPHSASTQDGLIVAPLWNRRITNLDAFTPYASPTMTEICPTRPSGISLACLSCHDGTGGGAVNGTDQHSVINVPKVNNPANGSATDSGAGCLKCHPGGGQFSRALTVMGGPDLTNDHPISMSYPVANSNYHNPPDVQKGWMDVKLFGGKVECPTCHAVHDPTNVPFLRVANGGSTLCLRCHNK